MAATASGVAPWPRIAWAKSPGSASMAAKMIMLTTRSVKTPSASRCPIMRTRPDMSLPSAREALLHEPGIPSSLPGGCVNRNR